EGVFLAIGEGNSALAVPKQRLRHLGLPLAPRPLAVMLAADVNQVGQVDHPHLPGHGVEPFLPKWRVAGVFRHRLEAAVVTQTIATKDLELIEEETLKRRGRLQEPTRSILGLPSQDNEGDPQIEFAAVVFSLANEEGLEWRKV